MKKCYHCKISFTHGGDPIDGNDFCSFSCSAEYIESVRQTQRCDDHFKNLPLGMKSDVYRLKPVKGETDEERVSRKTGELYHTDPVVKDVVDMEIERNKTRSKEEGEILRKAFEPLSRIKGEKNEIKK